MARLTKQSNRRIWVASRHAVNHTLSATGFFDTMEARDGMDFTVIETAEEKATAFIRGEKKAQIMNGARTAEEAIKMANDQNF